MSDNPQDDLRDQQNTEWLNDVQEAKEEKEASDD